MTREEMKTLVSDLTIEELNLLGFEIGVELMEREGRL